MATVAREEIYLEDLDGGRLWIMWSRSRRTVKVNVLRPGYAQATLDSDQASELAGFLRQGPPPRRPAKDDPEPVIDLADSDDNGARMRAAWNRQGNRLTLTVVPPADYPDAQPQEVVLRDDQIAALSRFLDAR